MRRGLESSVLILVTMGLVAFGLVMVYSATSASATVGGNDPSYYLKRQGIYAALGIVLMVAVVAFIVFVERAQRRIPVIADPGSGRGQAATPPPTSTSPS